MEKAESIIKSALQEIKVQASEAPIESVEFQDAILYMNRMMSAFSVDGVNIGYTTVVNLSDDITVPDGALEAIVFNLAIRIGNSYGFPIGQMLFNIAEKSRKTLSKLAVNVGPSLFPDTLPVGSGNEQDSINRDRFYSESDDPILTETSGFISIESETETQ